MNERSIFSRPVPVSPEYLKETPESRKQIVDYLVRAGAQAPSWYNCQPWRFEAGEEHIDVILDNSRDRSFYDWGKFNSLLACGAAIKNILVAAKGRGISARVEYFPDPLNQTLVASIRLAFETPSMPGENDRALEKAIWTRHTNTLFFENTPLTGDQLEALSSSAISESGMKLSLLTGEEDKEKVFVAAACAEQIRFSRRDLHEQLHRMIRWNENQAYADKTGYTLPSMGACGFGKSFFYITRPWIMMRLMNIFGASKNQAKRACQGMTHCSAIGLLTVKGRSNRDLLLAGQAMQQFWLTATTLGLDLQPHNSICQFYWAWKAGSSALYDPQEQQILKKAFGLFAGAFAGVEFDNDETGVFLFRVGKGMPVQGYTLRKDVV